MANHQTLQQEKGVEGREGMGRGSGGRRRGSGG